MRFTNLLFIFLFFGNQLTAQSLQITYAGDPISNKDRLYIEKIIQYEIDFYSQFGLADTLTMKLSIFDRREDGMAYLQELGQNPSNRMSGLYISHRKEAVILGRENRPRKGLDIISHELSHHFTREILGNRPPSWLNEGLAEYFGHCEISKKGVKHTLTSYECGRIRTMYMLKEVDLPSFLNSDRKNFMERQLTDDRYAYILSHALMTFWIEGVPLDILKSLIESLQNSKNPSSNPAQIDCIYPGGFQQFEKDFSTFYK